MDGVVGGAGWIIRDVDLEPAIVDLEAFRAGTRDDPLAPAIEALWLGRPQDALVIIDAMPSFGVRAAALRADCLRRLGRLDAALAALDALIDVHGAGQRGALLQHRGKAHLGCGNVHEAVADLEGAARVRLADASLLASTLQALRVARGRLRTEPASMHRWARCAYADGLGLAVGRVQLADHDERWPALFDDLATAIRPELPAEAIAIEHVGSTAVPGLSAKPILDVAVGLVPGSDVSAIVDPLVGAACIDRGVIDPASGDRLLAIESEPGMRVAHLHLVELGGPAWRDYLGFRDALRELPSVHRQYEATKRRLHDQGLARADYRVGKAVVIEEILASRSLR